VAIAIQIEPSSKDAPRDKSVLKKIVQVLLLAVGLVMTGHAVLSPMLMVIVMITGDFLAMSLTTDRVRASAYLRDQALTLQTHSPCSPTHRRDFSSRNCCPAH
jgi:hypothetical protein